MLKLIDVDDSMLNNINYGGKTEKYGVTYNNEYYLMKLSKDNDLSVYSEYLASNFIRSLHINCQEVYLGRYHGEIVNLIKDFCYDTEWYLQAYKGTKQSSVDTDLSDKEYTYNDVLHIIAQHKKITNKNVAIATFWLMFFCDAIIGNRDRHWGNWGYLTNGVACKPSPLYDNGAGLFPGVYSHLSSYEDDSYTFIKERVYEFPASLFLIYRDDKQRNCRTNYYQIISQGVFEYDLIYSKCLAKVRDISKHTVWLAMYNLVSELDLDPRLKKFYVEIVFMRYCCIILNEDFDDNFNYIEDLLCRIYL